MLLKSILYNYLPKFILEKLTYKNNSNKFGFLIHLGTINDIKKKYYLLNILPNKLLLLLLSYLPPLLVSKIRGVDKFKEKLYGFIILCPITARQMLENKDLAIKKINEALKLSEKIGLKIIGLGAYTSSVTNGGSDIIGKYNLAITNGNAYTCAIANKDINRIIINYYENNYKNLIIAIIGATGSIGSAVSKLLAQKKFKKLFLIGRNINNLKDLETNIRIFNKKTNLFLSTKIQDIKSADLIIVTTSASGAIIKPEYIKNKTIIYDITQPRNVNKQLFSTRKDVVVIDGGLVKTENINYEFNFNLPKNTIFACLAETMALTIKEKFVNFSIGRVSLVKINEIEKISKEIGFDSSPFLSFGSFINFK